jgi:hypothetical protein
VNAAYKPAKATAIILNAALVDSYLLWHTTTHEKAARILSEGFKDQASTRNSMFDSYTFPGQGVWVSTEPCFDDEHFDAPGLFGFEVERQAFISISVPLAEMKKGEHWRDDSWSAGQQYRFPAAVLNACAISLVQPVDALLAKLDFVGDRRLASLTEVAESGRGYGQHFIDLLRRALAAKVATALLEVTP